MQQVTVSLTLKELDTIASCVFVQAQEAILSGLEFNSAPTRVYGEFLAAIFEKLAEVLAHNGGTNYNHHSDHRAGLHRENDSARDPR